MKPAAWAAWSEVSPGTRAARREELAPNGRTAFEAVESFACDRAFDVVVVVDAVVDGVVDGVVDAVVDEPVEVLFDDVLFDDVLFDDVLFDDVVELVVEPVVVTGVGSVVPANAAPGTTRVAARARLPARASAAAGWALRRVRCMVPLHCERCRDGCTGTRT